MFARIANKLYGMGTGELDPIVASIFPLDRIALYDEPDFSDLMNSGHIRQRVAYPEQRNLDLMRPAATAFTRRSSALSA